ncbi:MAG: hypothetical protein QM527_04280 [Alphaproteobacteria bacterium]|nr:hypothetical protein [Alphaproteobacteria bacterium]
MTMTDLWLHGLNQEQASRAFMALLGWSLCLQTLEYWVIERRDHIMRWDVQ